MTEQFFSPTNQTVIVQNLETLELNKLDLVTDFSFKILPKKQTVKGSLTVYKTETDQIHNYTGNAYDIWILTRSGEDYYLQGFLAGVFYGAEYESGIDNLSRENLLFEGTDYLETLNINDMVLSDEMTDFILKEMEKDKKTGIVDPPTSNCVAFVTEGEPSFDVYFGDGDSLYSYDCDGDSCCCDNYTPVLGVDDSTPFTLGMSPGYWLVNNESLSTILADLSKLCFDNPEEQVAVIEVYDGSNLVDSWWLSSLNLVEVIQWIYPHIEKGFFVLASLTEND